MRKYIVVAVGCVALVLGTGKFAVSSGTDVMLGQITPTPTPGFVPWYYPSPSPWPSPVFSANAAVGNAFGAANFYNTGTSPYATVSPGTELLDTGRCFFICYGAQGNASHHLLAFGNDVSADAFTSIGAPDDCQAPMLMHCPGGVQDQVLSITQDGSGSPNGGYFVALDSAADWGVYGNVVAGHAVIAGAGVSTPEPSPTAGALVSYSGIGKGVLMMGSSADFATCDYGETDAQTVTCNKPFAAEGLTSSSLGVQPNGSAGGYAPEALPIGAREKHPKILSGSCSVSTSGACLFPSMFSFPDTGYNCTISAQGSTPVESSYAKTLPGEITIYSSSSGSITFSYICME